MTLPANGTLSYNGVTFDSLVKTKVSGKPVLDDAGRMVKFIMWTIWVRGYINTTSDTTTDTTWTSLRKRLTKIAQELHYDSRGFGTLSVNVPNGIVQDVAWGPIPELLSFTPLGGVNSAIVEWQVTTCIPECDNARYQEAVTAFTYGVDYSVDADAYTTIRTNGSLEIAVTQTAAGTVPDIVDVYRERVRPNPVLGFKREQNYNVAPNHSKLTFNITDTQMAQQAPIEGASTIDIDYTQSSTIKEAFHRWTCSLSGTIRVPAFQPKIKALDIFHIIVADKMRNSGVPGMLPQVIARAGRVVIVPQKIQYKDQVFGRDSSFSLEWIAIYPNAFGLQDIVAASGMWRTIPRTSFGSWLASMLVDKVYDVRGAAGVRMGAGDDILVDLCNGASVRPPQGRAIAPPPFGTGTAITTPAPIPKSPLPGNGLVPADGSWLDYRLGARLIQPSQIARHKPLNAGVRHDLPTALAAGEPNTLVGVTSAPDSDASATAADILQETSSPSARLVLSGYAIRVGYTIDPPQLLSVGNQRCVESFRDVQHAILAQGGGIAVVGAIWTIVYELPSPMGRIPLPSNPQLGAVGFA